MADRFLEFLDEHTVKSTVWHALTIRQVGLGGRRQTRKRDTEKGRNGVRGRGRVRRGRGRERLGKGGRDKGEARKKTMQNRRKRYIHRRELECEELKKIHVPNLQNYTSTQLDWRRLYLYKLTMMEII